MKFYAPSAQFVSCSAVGAWKRYWALEWNLTIDPKLFGPGDSLTAAAQYPVSASKTY